VYLMVGIAAAAAASVLIYNHFKDTRPDIASLSTKRAQQLAAVVLVMSRAVEGVIEALSYGLRPEPLSVPSHASNPRRLMDAWDDEEYR
jgi:hypothetical protein